MKRPLWLQEKQTSARGLEDRGDGLDCELLQGAPRDAWMEQ